MKGLGEGELMDSLRGDPVLLRALAAAAAPIAEEKPKEKAAPKPKREKA